MELRDQIAVAILPTFYADYAAMCRTYKADMDERWMDGLASKAYKMADAMIAVRSARASTSQQDENK